MPSCKEYMDSSLSCTYWPLYIKFGSWYASNHEFLLLHWQPGRVVTLIKSEDPKVSYRKLNLPPFHVTFYFLKSQFLLFAYMFLSICSTPFLDVWYASRDFAMSKNDFLNFLPFLSFFKLKCIYVTKIDKQVL